MDIGEAWLRFDKLCKAVVRGTPKQQPVRSSKDEMELQTKLALQQATKKVEQQIVRREVHGGVVGKVGGADISNNWM